MELFVQTLRGLTALEATRVISLAVNHDDVFSVAQRFDRVFAMILVGRCDPHDVDAGCGAHRGHALEGRDAGE